MQYRNEGKVEDQNFSILLITLILRFKSQQVWAANPSFSRLLSCRAILCLENGTAS